MTRWEYALFALLLVPGCAAHGVTIVVPNFPGSQLSISVGSRGANVDRVDFDVPGAGLGSGVPVTGSPPIEIVLLARAAPANSRSVELIADSRVPLSNGFATLPFSAISWTASDADIPSGRFTDGVQRLVTFFNSRQITVTHTFSYDNRQILDEGTYTGRVTYTLVMP